MQCQSRTRAGNRMHLCGVAEFFLNAGGGSRLNELSKARPGVGKSPRRKLDSKFVEGFPNDFDRLIVHKKVSIRCPNYRRRRRIELQFAMFPCTSAPDTICSAHPA